MRSQSFLMAVIAAVIAGGGAASTVAILHLASCARSESDDSVGAAAAAAVVKSDNGTPERADRVIAYYFHWTSRCATCLEIEEYTSIALRDSFGSELDAGRLEWRPRNMELPEYEHYRRDFDLTTPSLVLVRFDDGELTEWKVLAEVWELVHWRPELEEYVRSEAGTYLTAAFGS